MGKMRLWWRLFLWYLWVPVLALAAIGWYGSAVVATLYQRQLYGDLEARARLCGKPIATLLERGKTAEVDALCKELGQSSKTRITVVLPSGQVAGDSEANPGDMENHGRREEVLEALAGRVGRWQHYSSAEQEDRIYVAVPLLRGGPSAPADPPPLAVVRTSLPLSELTRTLGAVRRQFLAVALAGLLLQAVITLVISRRLSRPLEEIKAGAERFAAGDLAHRLRAMESAEMGTLAETMNRMAEQLDERIQTVLRQQNEREAMLSSMEEGVLAIDNEGTILSVNQACATLLHEQPARLQGRTIYEVIRKADLLRFMESALAGASPVEGELQIRGLPQAMRQRQNRPPDVRGNGASPPAKAAAESAAAAEAAVLPAANDAGEPPAPRRPLPPDRWVSAHGTVLHDPQRGKIGVLIVLHDVTRLRHLEEVRRDFVANVSHELRTPITSIKGFLETLVDGAFDDKENAPRFLQIMLRQVNRLDAIIGDLLMLSRIEKGSEGQLIEVAREPIRPILQAAIEMCEKKAADKPVRIDLVCPEELAGEINAALLEQAVVNLLDNAVKYSNPQAVVEVRAAREGAELVIRVKDQGCGIEAQHLPRVFERFYRVDKARSRELGGTGLGLAIVRHIALAHRGSVSVESELGRGSTFCLRLPCDTHCRPHGAQH